MQEKKLSFVDVFARSEIGHQNILLLAERAGVSETVIQDMILADKPVSREEAMKVLETLNKISGLYPGVLTLENVDVFVKGETHASLSERSSNPPCKD